MNCDWREKPETVTRLVKSKHVTLTRGNQPFCTVTFSRFTSSPISIDQQCLVSLAYTLHRTDSFPLDQIKTCLQWPHRARHQRRSNAKQVNTMTMTSKLWINHANYLPSGQAGLFDLHLDNHYGKYEGKQTLLQIQDQRLLDWELDLRR